MVKLWGPSVEHIDGPVERPMVAYSNWGSNSEWRWSRSITLLHCVGFFVTLYRAPQFKLRLMKPEPWGRRWGIAVDVGRLSFGASFHC